MRKRKTAQANQEFDPRIPLSLERVIVDRDYAVLSSMCQDYPGTLDAGLGELERMIAASHATDCLDKLCSDHCDRRALLWLLHPFSRAPVFKNALWSEKPGPGSVEELLGLTSKELEMLINNLNADACKLDIVNSQADFSALLMLNRQLYPVARLPQTLRTCIRVLEYAARHFADHAHIYDNIAKARLTSYVLAKVEGSLPGPRRKQRREFHDGEIATLISAVSGDEDCRYDSADHRMWRRKHYQRLRMLDPNVDQKLFVVSFPKLPGQTGKSA